MLRILQKIRDWNVAASWATTPHQLWETRGFAVYDLVARALLGRPGTDVVVDVGGGRTWHFGEEYRANPRLKLIGVDIDPEELALNPVIDHAIASDICQSLEVPDNSVDLLLCRATVEHLHDTGAFLRNVHKALKPGARAAFVFANKWAPPLVINRLIPQWVAVRLIHALIPGSDGIQGFKAYYDKCSFSQFKRELLKIGFEVEYEYVSYYSSSYFQFLLPLHFLSIVSDFLRQALSIKNLGSMNLFVVRKVASGSGQQASTASV